MAHLEKVSDKVYQYTADKMMNKMLPKESGRLQVMLVNAMQMYAEEMVPKSKSEKTFWKDYFTQLGTNIMELASLGVDVDELMDIHY